MPRAAAAAQGTRARRRGGADPPPRRVLAAVVAALLLLASASAKPDPRACDASSSSSTSGTCASPEPNNNTANTDPPPPLVCVVVRTYWAHGTHGDDGGGGETVLPRLLRSLKAQRHSNWRALLLVLDSRPFPDLHHLVADFGDPRVEVFAEWISAKYAARAPAAAAGGGNGGGGGGDSASRGWAPSYHDALYNATDAAVRACPRETEWLAVTNGDNEYDPDFLAAAVAAGEAPSGADGQGADIVAADYYSRYVRPTAPPCDRFSATLSPHDDAAAQGAPAAKKTGEKGAGKEAKEDAKAGEEGGKTTTTTTTTPTAAAPPCKSNLLRWCQTDLAATVYYWPRIVEEDVRFWDASIPGDAAGSHDGRLAEGLASVGLAGLRRRKLAAEAKAAAAAAAKAAAGASASDKTPPPPPPPVPNYVPSLASEEKAWRAVRLFPGERCMVDHHPSPQRCAEEKGVWDDSGRATQGATGGRCLGAGEAGILLARDKGIALPGDEQGGGKPPAPNRMELVEVDVAHDGRSFGRQGKALPRLRCLRLRDRAAWPREAAFFGPKCHAEQEGGEGWTYG